MRLTRYGRDVIVITLLIAVVLLVAGVFLAPVIAKVLLIALGLFLAVFTLYFFRDPPRSLPEHADAGDIVISPADGRVFLVREIDEPEFVDGPATQIAIFLSPLDVHVNRIPISGRVELVSYHRGAFAAAFKEKSELNEQTHIGISSGRIRLLMKQIAGSIARRIVYELKEGDDVVIGEPFGMIKFGSRTDVIVPSGMQIDVREGDRVVGGVTVLCHIPTD